LPTTVFLLQFISFDRKLFFLRAPFVESESYAYLNLVDEQFLSKYFQMPPLHASPTISCARTERKCQALLCLWRNALNYVFLVLL